MHIFGYLGGLYYEVMTQTSICNVKCDTNDSYTPKPILAKIDNPKRLKFVINGDKVQVMSP